MAYGSKIPSQPAEGVINRIYGGLRGVDFSSDAGNVGLSRAAGSVNMYRTYSAKLGECVATRPGFRRFSSCLGAPIYGIFTAAFAGGKKAVIHAGSKLLEWSNYPAAATAETLIERYTTAAQRRSRALFFAGKLWFCDGDNYLCWDGSGNFVDVCSVATVPVTTVNRLPAGGGSPHQQVNLLTAKRKNSFSSDGSATLYHLDASGLDQTAMRVWVNGAELSGGFTANYTDGTLTFAAAPAAANPSGTDNVVIEFSKTVSGAADKIRNCRLAAVYDDRLFMSGDPSSPGVSRYSAADDPAYFGDLSYSRVGGGERAINGLLVVFDRLFSLCDNKVFTQQGEDSGDNLVSRIYPVSGGAECSGAIAPFCCANFRDDPVFLSRMGLEGVDRLTNYESERYVGHRSSTVDGRLCREASPENAYCCEYGGYLLILLNGRIYLADSRLTDRGGYEWFYWEDIGLYENDLFKPAEVIVSDGELLLIGTQNGYVCRLNNDLLRADGSGELSPSAYADDETRAITSRWEFCFDDFGRPNKYKTLLKKGNVIHARAFPHSTVKVSYRTDSEHTAQITSVNAGYFDFAETYFDDFTFNTFEETDLVFKKKIRRFKRLQIILSCSEAGRCMGIYSMVLTARLGGSYRK